jgi:hypothetical protein
VSIDFKELEGWTRSATGNAEMAGQIAEVSKKGRSDRERTHFIKD